MSRAQTAIMEASSPLAALHRPTSIPAWGGRDIFRPRPQSHYSSGSTSGLSSMGLREQLHRNTGDYFNAKEVRGSSPAASLAADLSQNFRIDSDVSPLFPTPRRALFTTANVMSTMDCREEYTTTPPLPSSSPAPLMESMQVSPLPHKAPFAHQIEVTSPTPLSTPDADDVMMLDSPAPIPRRASLEPPKPSMVDRKIAAPRRPSLSRMKGFSTSAVMSRAQLEQPLSGLRLGQDFDFKPTASPLSLGECFDSTSPPPIRRPTSANSQCAPISLGFRSRSQFSSASNSPALRPGHPLHSNSSSGSSSNHISGRRQGNPFLRNRKQFRRSLSMFEHPADLMKPKAEVDDRDSSRLHAVQDVEEAYEPTLPHFMPDDPTDTIPRITKQTMLEVLNGKLTQQFDHKMIIDCRFEYEYEGGHIDSAVNYNDKELLSQQLFNTPIEGRTLLIFHCEYSAHRAPLMARHIRSQDRTINAEHYPRLTYPEVYILEGGYSGFFVAHRDRCFPPAYVEMSDEKHQRTCERELSRLKARKGLGRAQTFAFGQREACIDDSPTGPSLSQSRRTPTFVFGYPTLLGDRSPARRLASY